MSKQVMVCKMQLHVISDVRSSSGTQSKVEFGAVWEGSQEKQALSENAIFGDMTPSASFNATIRNQSVIANLTPGKKYYVTFTEAPD